jgi:DNA uptake protein ComE-like DNA-binding protein
MKKFKATALASIIALSFGTMVFAAETKTQEQPAKPVANVRPVDINTASEDQLKSLPGVGEENSKKIIAGRPYHKKSELKTKKVISAELYEKIQKLIVSVC